MRMTYYRVVLNIEVHECDLGQMRLGLTKSDFIIDPNYNFTDRVDNIIEITTEEVEVTDSR